jgi:hypothetical protein
VGLWRKKLLIRTRVALPAEKGLIYVIWELREGNGISRLCRSFQLRPGDDRTPDSLLLGGGCEPCEAEEPDVVCVDRVEGTGRWPV